MKLLIHFQTFNGITVATETKNIYVLSLKKLLAKQIKLAKCRCPVYNGHVPQGISDNWIYVLNLKSLERVRFDPKLWNCSVNWQATVQQAMLSRHLSVRLDMMTSSNGNIFRVTGHLCGEFTGPRWIPRTKASNAELWCFLWSASESTVE